MLPRLQIPRGPHSLLQVSIGVLSVISCALSYSERIETVAFAPPGFQPDAPAQYSHDEPTWAESAPLYRVDDTIVHSDEAYAHAWEDGVGVGAGVNPPLGELPIGEEEPLYVIARSEDGAGPPPPDFPIEEEEEPLFLIARNEDGATAVVPAKAVTVPAAAIDDTDADDDADDDEDADDHHHGHHGHGWGWDDWDGPWYNYNFGQPKAKLGSRRQDWDYTNRNYNYASYGWHPLDKYGYTYPKYSSKLQSGYYKLKDKLHLKNQYLKAAHHLHHYHKHHGHVGNQYGGGWGW